MLNKRKKVFQILLDIYITDRIWGRVVGVTVHCCILLIMLLLLFSNTRPKQWPIQKVLIHSRNCWTQQRIWRMLLTNWDVPETGCRDSNNSTSFEYLSFVNSCILIYSHTSLHSWGFSMLDHLSVWECTADEQIETLQKERMAKVLTVKFCCGKLDQLSCPLLQSLWTAR